MIRSPCAVSFTVPFKFIRFLISALCRIVKNIFASNRDCNASIFICAPFYQIRKTWELNIKKLKLGIFFTTMNH